jgi:SAM-dependent methyltransferase
VDDLYSVDARYYDLIHADQENDIGLWLSFAGRTDRPVLEVGTGTGRIALALALAGHEVTGIDPSPGMLAAARQNAADEGAEVTLVQGRAQDLTLESDEYGFVLVPQDVFLYCEDGEEQIALLRALSRTMHFNATLVLDLPGPGHSLDPSLNGQPVLAWSGETPGGGMLDVWHVHEDDLAAQTRWLRVTYDRTEADGAVRREFSEHRLRYVYRFEAEYLLHLSGLRLADVYGDYDLGPLTTESERMILVARRADG